MRLCLGYLLRSPIKKIQQSVLETLYKSIQPNNKSPIAPDNYDGLKPASIDYLLRIQLMSDLCETLVKVRVALLSISLLSLSFSLRHCPWWNMISAYGFSFWSYYKSTRPNHVLICSIVALFSSPFSLDECVAKMLTYDCVNRLVVRMNDSDASGEWVTDWLMWTAMIRTWGTMSLQTTLSNHWIIMESIRTWWSSTDRWSIEFSSDDQVSCRAVRTDRSMLKCISVFCRKRFLAKWHKVIANTIDNWG